MTELRHGSAVSMSASGRAAVEEIKLVERNAKRWYKAPSGRDYTTLIGSRSSFEAGPGQLIAVAISAVIFEDCGAVNANCARVRACARVCVHAIDVGSFRRTRSIDVDEGTRTRGSKRTVYTCRIRKIIRDMPRVN